MKKRHQSVIYMASGAAILSCFMPPNIPTAMFACCILLIAGLGSNLA